MILFKRKKKEANDLYHLVDFFSKCSITAEIKSLDNPKKVYNDKKSEARFYDTIVRCYESLGKTSNYKKGFDYFFFKGDLVSKKQFKNSKL